MSTTTPQKISLYNINDLKTTSDDALSPYLTSLPKPYAFKEQHSLIDTRLAVGSTAVTIAGVLFYTDWKFGWEATKPYTLPACVIYFVLNSFLTYWIWFVEAGTVFVGVREGGQKIVLKSFVKKKHSPIYSLRVRYQAPSGQKWEDKEIQGHFTDWFNIHGYLDKKAFRRWLSTNIEVVGLADPASKQIAEQTSAIVVDDVTTTTTTTGLATGADTPAVSKKAKKKA